jgi:hypothetical protein
MPICLDTGAIASRDGRVETFRRSFCDCDTSPLTTVLLRLTETPLTSVEAAIGGRILLEPFAIGFTAAPVDRGEFCDVCEAFERCDDRLSTARTWLGPLTVSVDPCRAGSWP